MNEKNLYVLLDSRNLPIARGTLLSPPDAPALQVRVLEDKISAVMEHEEIQLVPLSSDGPSLLGRIIRSRNDDIVVEKLQNLGSELRQNLRMPVHFQSFIYPLTGKWRGRRKVESNDMSCGGVSFFCANDLADGEEVEIVIPVTAQPLILRCQVLRRRPSNRAEHLYAAKFVNLCNDEEVKAREAVFGIQVRSKPRVHVE